MTERPTPETDALVPSQGRRRTMREYIDELEAHARRLERQRDELTDRWEKSANAFLIEQGKFEAAERQRDELMEALERFARLPGDYNLIMDYGWVIRDAKQTIARVKGGTP